MNLDFRTKLFMTICISLLLVTHKFHLKFMYLSFVIGLIPFILLLIRYKTKKYFVISFLYITSVFLNHILTSNITTINFVPILIFGIFSRMLPGIMMGYYTLKTTKMVDLVKSLELMKMPYYIIIPISVMHRFFYSIKHDYKQILKAMKLQGLTFKKLYKEPIKMLEYRIVPLSMCALRSADDVSISAMSRGLVASNTRSSISDAKLKYYDYLIIILMAILLVMKWWI